MVARWTRSLIVALVSVALFQAFASPAAADSLPASILQDLHRSNQEALELGRLGQRKGSTQEARRFGDIVFYDHRAAERKVAAMAKAAKVQLMNVPAADRPLPGGRAFDATFAEIVIADGQKDQDAVSAAINSTSDKSLQKLLNQQLAMVQKHIDIAKKLLATEHKE